MITELSIEGFKSFGSPAETIELGPLNFVVGANASGKSNLLGALRFLQNAVAHDVSYAVSEMGGNAEVSKQAPSSASSGKTGSAVTEDREELQIPLERELGKRGSRLCREIL